MRAELDGLQISSGAADLDAPIVTRAICPADLEEVKELQRDLFPVRHLIPVAGPIRQARRLYFLTMPDYALPPRYTDSFYSKLFSPGYFTLVGCCEGSGACLIV